MEKIQKITKEMTIGEVIEKYPETTSVFLNYGLFCVGCPAAQGETIEEAVKLHQIDLKKFLKDLNKSHTLSKQKVRDKAAKKWGR